MKYLILLSFVLLASACSRSGIMVRMFDDLATSKADDYFELTSKQREELKKDLQKDVDVARKELLPQIAKSLRSLEPQVHKDKPDAELLAAQMAEFQNYFKKLSSYFGDTAVKTSLSLEPSQFFHFAKDVREDIEKDSEAKAREKIEKRYKRSVEFWIGGISSLQKEKIQNFLKAHPFPIKLEKESKEHVLNQFLEAKKNQENLKKFVKDFFTDYESVRLPAYTEALNAHKKAFQKFLIDEFWGTVSKSQKDTLKENLSSRAEDLESIARYN
ncbi:MAG: hypothetical protein OM95_09415 [Bdellovibrio sp. ArHS]|uniref:DUF6279 family lipoprotein n=1 Tax=Bdellovibrio sp. ArHS TaxID=1569284 RepID=UPI000583E97B|nr:DUF6279 family lipoprotein [Bdellovibrio sp. ArHS]KHD88352.1 MAG: hypothetical protein OM95_09415 [Bdellovibrio sp. ArHS]